MAYQFWHHYKNGNISDCRSGNRWIPGTGGGDYNDGLRDEISNAYNSLFGRYGEPGGVEGHLVTWVEGGGPATYGSIYELVRQNGIASGELANVEAFGKNTGQAPGSCPPPPSASISASPSSIILGNSSTLFWSSSGVTSASISPGIGGVSTSGSRTVSPSSTTTYTLTASGPRGTVTAQATVTVTIPPPPTVSFSVSSTSICRGSSATLTWNVTGYVSSVSINQGIGSVATSGSRSISPTTTTTYTITASGIGGTTTRTATLTVYQPTTTDLSLDALTIIRGQNTTLRWVTTGDATSSTIDQGIGSVNINGNRNISPSETITYTINVTGICTNSSDFVTLTVYQPPTVSITGPVSINYGQQGTLSYEATEVDISLKLSPVYNYKNGSLSGSMFDVNLPLGKNVSESIQTQIPYNDFGPFSVTYVIVATGNGGQESKQIIIPINVDETPTNFLVPESEDLLKSQAPIYTPDAIVTSYEIVIDAIDIPVEVKADKPILIDVNSQEDWKSIREL